MGALSDGGLGKRRPPANDQLPCGVSWDIYVDIATASQILDKLGPSLGDLA